MAAGLILPEDVSPVDAVRVLDFLNSVSTAAVLASMVGFSEGLEIGTMVAAAILAQRARTPFVRLTEVLAVTGVTPARFTEIVAALSGARPPGTVRAQTVTIRSAIDSPLLGQGLSLTVQLLDRTGQGIPGAEVTCVTTWGTLTGRSGNTVQRGASARLVSESGGIVRLRLDPPTAPKLSELARAMLETELAALLRASTPRERAVALATFANHYRAEAADELRDAVDRLYDDFQSLTVTSDSGWSVIPATLIAFPGGEAADTVGLLTLPIRNWLGAFVSALREAINSDHRLDDALVNVNLEGTTAAVLARDIFGAQNAFTGLERGVLGQRYSAEVAGGGVSRFLEKNAAQIDGLALIDATRVAGASTAAIASGGFAVFDAIGSFRQVESNVGLASTLEGRFSALDQRLVAVEATKADISVVNALTDQMARNNAVLDQRITTLATSQVTRADLGALDARIVSIEATRVTQAELLGLESRIRTVERDQVTREDLSVLTGRITRLESSQIGRAEFTALESRLTQQIATDIGIATTGLRTELGGRIDAKADQIAVINLQRSVSGLQSTTSNLSTRVDTVDTRVTNLGATRTIRPGP